MAETTERKKLYLIDGFHTIFRAFYAIRELSNSKGEPTNAVFGFVQILRKILRDEKPDYVGVAWDVSDETTLRRENYLSINLCSYYSILDIRLYRMVEWEAN